MSPAFSVATVPSGQKEDRDEGRTCLDERLRCKAEPFYAHNYSAAPA